MKKRKITSTILILIILLNTLFITVFADIFSIVGLTSFLVTNSFQSMAYSDTLKLFVTVGDGGIILTSQNSVSWTPRTSGAINSLNSIIWDGSKFVTVGNGGLILTSIDGINWVTQVSGVVNNLNSIVWNSSQFIAVGSSGMILSSVDGINWVPKTSGTTNTLNSVTWNGSKFVAVGTSGTILTSSNGTDWSASTSNVTQTLYSVAWSGSSFAAVGTSGTVVTSSDGITWTKKTSNTTNSLYSISWNSSKFVAVGDNGAIITSLSGATWTARTNTFSILCFTGYLNNRNMIAGSDGYIALIRTANTPASIVQVDITLEELTTANISTALVLDSGGFLIENEYILTYSIANTNVATVDALGTITAKEYIEGANTTTLTISTIENTSLQKIINVTVTDAVSGEETGGETNTGEEETPPSSITDEELETLLEGVELKLDITKNTENTTNITNNLMVIKKMLEAQDSTNKNKLLIEVNGFINALQGNQITIGGIINKIFNK